MGKLRLEEILIENSFTETQVYEGEPPTNVAINGIHPSLVRVYASTSEREYQKNVYTEFTALAYEWELYFAHVPNSLYSLYKQEYFFPTMTDKTPDYSVFDLPQMCLQEN